MRKEAVFSVIDYLIFGFLLAISALIGVFFGCFGNKKQSAKELLVANRQMGVSQYALNAIIIMIYVNLNKRCSQLL
jgi:sodium-coupled monocarboxylate transporter 8/12